MDKLKLIKLIVFILTFLLVFGILSAAGIIYRQVSQTPAARHNIPARIPDPLYSHTRLHLRRFLLITEPHPNVYL